MASNNEFTLEVVRDFMISKGGRVTNHELVKQFKYFLTNAQNKELARNNFKQIVNTLANISTEGGEKYLVLKRRFRIGTPLSESEYLASPMSPSSPQFSSPIQFSPYSSPHQVQACSPNNVNSGSPGIPPRYRAPPPYRPPPAPGHNEDANLYKQNLSSMSSQVSLKSVESYNSNPDGSFVSNDYNCARYNEPKDLGIPPVPQMQRSSSTSTLLPASVNQIINSQANIHAPVRPKSLSLVGSYETVSDSSSIHPDQNEYLSSTSSLSSMSQTPSTAYASPVEEQPPPLPLRKKQETWKENTPPEMKKSFSGSDKRINSTSGEEERKVSVKEATQKFNRMASQGDLSSSRNSSKSNRNSRADRDDDDSSSIHSYGPDGQDWLVAAAKSDYPEILRLLKIHPTLSKFKDLANGYTALHWASKHGRVEVVKLLIQSYQVDINARSNGGYSSLHIAAIYNRQDVFDLLSHYGGDLNLRDYSGKKPRQYNTKGSPITINPQKKQVQRRHSVKEMSGFLRIGSLNVKVRKTAPFNNRLSRDLENKLHHTWGSADSLTDNLSNDSKSMPPPKINQIKKKKAKKEQDNMAMKMSNDHPMISAPINTINPDSDSDTACGFGSDWQ